jgi:hypothetical protein
MMPLALETMMEKRKFFQSGTVVLYEDFHNMIADDITLNNTVKMILLTEPLLFDSIVNVNTHGQVVTLSGFVDSEIELDHLNKIVTELRKFVYVENIVQVIPTLWFRPEAVQNYKN